MLSDVSHQSRYSKAFNGVKQGRSRDMLSFSMISKHNTGSLRGCMDI